MMLNSGSGGGNGITLKNNSDPLDAVFQWDHEAPMARMPKESGRASRALADYILLGPARSLDKLLASYAQRMEAYKRYTADPSAWPSNSSIPQEPPTAEKSTVTLWSTKYAWVRRAQRYDEMQLEVEKLEHEVMRATIRRERRELLIATQKRLRAALASLDVKDASWNEVTSGIIKISEQLRIEFGDNGPPEEKPNRIKMVVIRTGGGGNVKTTETINVDAADVIAVDATDQPESPE